MSSTILTVIVLVVMWLVVLVPMFVRRADDPVELADLVESADPADLDDPVLDAMDGAADSGYPAGAARSGRVLARGGLTGELDAAAGHDSADFDPAELEPALDSPDSLDSPDAGTGQVASDHPDPRSARARMLARRRRTLAILAALMLATLVLVLLTRGSPGAWVLQVGCDLLLAGFLVGLRREARVEVGRRLARVEAERAEARAARERARRAAEEQARARAAQAERAGRAARRSSARSVRDHLSLADQDDPVERRRVV